MSSSPLAEILIHDAPGEYRAVAIDDQGQACRLFFRRWNDDTRRHFPGQVLGARVRAFADDQGGAFIETDMGEGAYLALKTRDGLTEGQHLNVLIKASARREKLARAVVASDGQVGATSALEAWVASLPSGAQLPCRDDPQTVAAAFDEAGLDTVTLPHGGWLHLEPTRALLAIDVDTAGRQGRGSAGARARSIGIEAASTAARQLALRDIGGAIVLDCIGPLNKQSGEAVRAAFVTTFSALSARKIKALAPSAFGLMEASLEWGECPIVERLTDRDGAPTAETLLLSLFREVEHEAAANGSALFELALSKPVYGAYLHRQSECDKVLAERFGGRVSVKPNANGPDEVRRR
ncbi:MAG: ribonuclease E/G [Pseudomonadota bacterium]